MNILNVKIQKGKFIGFTGREVAEWDFTHIIGNGWYCIIAENGTLICRASKNYANGRHLIKFVIHPSKWAKLTIRKGNSKETLLKTFRVKKWPLNGELIITDGEIDTRRVYFNEIVDSNSQKAYKTATK